MSCPPLQATGQPYQTEKSIHPMHRDPAMPKVESSARVLLPAETSQAKPVIAVVFTNALLFLRKSVRGLCKSFAPATEEVGSLYK
jgi:hypothetical protein